MKKWKIEISQNCWEYSGWVFIKAANLVKTGHKTIVADGVEIEFDEWIGEITYESGKQSV